MMAHGRTRPSWVALVTISEDLPQDSTAADLAVVDLCLDRIRRKKDYQFRIGELPFP
jgi:hypothetical protein